jgi:glycine cleavage system aminomethyltransferase T
MEKREELYNYYKSQLKKIEIEDNSIIKKYSSVAEEYKILKQGVGIRDLSNYSKTFIHGKDSESLLRRLTTNKIIELDVLEWIKTLFVNNDGNIIDRTLLMKFEDYFILIGSSTEEMKLFKWIKRFIRNDDIALSDSRDDYSLFEIMGAQATSYMSIILGDKYSELNDKNILRVQVDDYFVHGIKVNDCGAIDKYLVIVDSIHAIKTLEIMRENKSVFDFGMVGEDAYNIFRIENGVPIAPNELNDSVNPIEVNLGSEVCTQKHDYIGHERVEEQNDELSKFVRINFKSEFVYNKLPIAIIDNHNNEIGIVTSFANTDVIDSPIGLGFIDLEYSLNGSTYFAVDGKNKVEINISELK